MSTCIDADVNTLPLAPAVGLGNVVVIGDPIDTPQLAPSERLAIPTALSGEQRTNGGRDFAFIRAEHDLAAVNAYSNRYRDQPHALWAYTRETERFVLWLVVVRGVALIVDDGGDPVRRRGCRPTIRRMRYARFV